MVKICRGVQIIVIGDQNLRKFVGGTITVVGPGLKIFANL